MRHPFFRFNIKKTNRSTYLILIGCAWDSSKASYRLLEDSAFGAKMPELTIDFPRAETAQAGLKILKNFIARRN